MRAEELNEALTQLAKCDKAMEGGCYVCEKRLIDIARSFLSTAPITREALEGLGFDRRFETYTLMIQHKELFIELSVGVVAVVKCVFHGKAVRPRPRSVGHLTYLLHMLSKETT